jgi:hypothetical protein
MGHQNALIDYNGPSIGLWIGSPLINNSDHLLGNRLAGGEKARAESGNG